MNDMLLDIDLPTRPKIQIADKITRTANHLFSSVKAAPPSLRKGFPDILKNNNFAISLLISKKYIFLEVCSKLKAIKSRDSKRIEKYHDFFAPIGSDKNAAFRIDKSRMVRVGKVNIEKLQPFKIGPDASLCVWDTTAQIIKNATLYKEKIDLLYLVSLGESLNENNAWEEFDALIRMTISGWSEE